MNIHSVNLLRSDGSCDIAVLYALQANTLRERGVEGCGRCNSHWSAVYCCLSLTSELCCRCNMAHAHYVTSLIVAFPVATEVNTSADRGFWDVFEPLHARSGSRQVTVYAH